MDLIDLLEEIEACTLCEPHLPAGVRPVVRAHSGAKILIAGQAPGRRVHTSGTPFDDASGDRLRQWMGTSKNTFYDRSQIAIVPMGFCYPGSGKSGDLAPRLECALTWRKRLLAELWNVELTLVVGLHAMRYHLPEQQGSLTDIVKRWSSFAPRILPLPHPSPRNNIWLKKNPWFERELLPVLAEKVRVLLKAP